MADVRGLVSDPQFNQLSPSEQKTALARVSGDDSFNTLDENSLNEFKTKLTTNNIIPPKAGLRPQSTYEHLTSYLPSKEKVAEFARPVIGAGTLAAGTAAASTFGAPAAAAYGAGLGLSYINDLAVQAAQGKAREPSTLGGFLSIEPGSLMDRTLSFGEMTASNEIGGRLLNKLGSVYKAVKGGFPAGSTESILKDFKATYAQYSKSPTAKLIEDLFGNKVEAMKRSALLARAGLVNEAQQISGTTPLTDPHAAATQVLSNVTDAFSKSQLQSNTEADAARLIAKQNPAVITKNVPSNIINPKTRQPIMTQVSTSVDGPTHLENSIYWAKNYLANVNQALFKPDEEKPLIEAAQNILTKTNPQFDQNTGKLISHDPISFDQAWDWKKYADSLGFAERGKGNAVSSNMTTLSKALNKDIDASIPNWSNNGPQAQQAWENAKAITQKRITTLQAGDEVQKLLNTVNSPVSKINAIIDDPNQLQRALNAGAIAQPGSAPPNMRKQLQNYQIMRLLNDSWDTTQNMFNGSKLLDAVRDPEMQASYEKLYGKANLDRLDRFASAINDVSTKSDKISPWMKVSLTKQGLFMGGALLSHMLSGSNLIAGGAAGIEGGLLAATGIGKLLTNPTAAEYLIRAAQGAPLTASQQFVGKIFASALNGAQMSLKMTDGTSKDVVIKDQKFVPVETQ